MQERFEMIFLKEEKADKRRDITNEQILDSVEELCQEISRSKIQLILINFFYRNPSAFDTGEGVARWVGIEVDKVKEALLELNKVGIVKKFGEGTGAIYYYSPDDFLLERIDELVELSARA